MPRKQSNKDTLAHQRIDDHEKLCLIMQEETNKKIKDLHQDIHRLEKIMISSSGFYDDIHNRNCCCSYIEIKLKDLVRLIRENNKFIITDLKRESKYNYQKYTRDNDDGSRHYNVGNKKIPSVTTILSATQSEEKKASLDKWRERVGYQEAQELPLRQLSEARRCTMF